MIIKINNYEIKPSDKNNLHFFDLYDTSSKSKVIEYGVPLQHLLIKLAHYEVNSKDQESKAIEKLILNIHDQQVMIDYDIATLYGVETKVLNQAVKRNIDRFPDRFMFQLSKEEKDELVTNCDRFKKLKHSSSCPYAFTEQGIAMLSAILKSETAVSISIQIMDAFVAMRHILTNNAHILLELEIYINRKK